VTRRFVEIYAATVAIIIEKRIRKEKGLAHQNEDKYNDHNLRVEKE
jgi:hypothetical protein